MNEKGAQSLTARQIAEKLEKSPRWIRMLARKDGWSYYEETVRGGKIYKYDLNDPKIQKTMRGSNGNGDSEAPAPLQTSTAMARVDQSSLFNPLSSAYNGDSKALSEKNTIPDVAGSSGIREVENPRTPLKITIIHEALNMDRDWKKGKKAWIGEVALKHGFHWDTIYRWLRKMESTGDFGVLHGNTVQGKDISWNPERSKSWDSQVLNLLRAEIVNRPHRRFTIKGVYKKIERIAAAKALKCGSYPSAVFWAKRIDPNLKVYARGGAQALDDVLPPIRRKKSNVVAFELLVGDQHRFNFWVQDKITGEIFRMEGYFWFDIRTNLIYGFALARHYDAMLMGMSLLMGVYDFGLFNAVYTDNGRPEQSKYIKGVLEEIAKYGAFWGKTEDISELIEEKDENDPQCIPPGTQINARVRNPKGKPAERQFGVIEDILENEFCVPGRAKRITDNANYQREDAKEIQALAKAKKLLTPEEFVSKVYQMREYYNKEKPHRALYGELREGGKPLSVTPFQALELCKERGFVPKFIPRDIANIIFLPKAERKVRLGQIEFRGNFYEDRALIRIHDWVELRYNPMNLGSILVFHKGHPLCLAKPIEWSGYKDAELTKKKNHEKAAIKKDYTEEYKMITSGAFDFLQYSTVPEDERAPALLGREKKKQALERGEIYAPRTGEELEKEILTLKNEEVKLLPSPRDQKPLPERPAFFRSELDHFKWARDYRRRGGSLSEEELTFVARFEGRMSPGQAEYWEAERETFEQAEIQRGRT